MTENKFESNLILRLQPMQRILLSVIVAAICFFCIRNAQLDWKLNISILWIAFAFSFIGTSWIVFFKLPVNEIVKRANKEDGSRVFVFIFVLITTFASLFIVMLLMLGKKQEGHEILSAIIAVAGMMVSWVLVHTIFTFHYARMYYFKAKDDTPQGEALEFPGDEKKPDYLDFAYFSFIIGMTFQVSDVEIASRLVRRTALAHSLLAFAINTFVVALTINLIAGLKG
jgi:uncharacterized membrane protein